MEAIDEERGREGDGNQIKEARERVRGVEVCGWRGAQDVDDHEGEQEHRGTLHEARRVRPEAEPDDPRRSDPANRQSGPRSEEHTSELQSRQYLVCRLLLE